MSYADISGHRSMVFDASRNPAYARALEKLVTPSSVVMDLGAGLGQLGMMAAKMGAAQVHLVEPTAAIEVARMAAADNNLHSVKCARTTVEKLKLDTKVDVIVSVFTGNFLLTEDLLPSLFYARDHHLAPGGRLIPDRGRMEVVPVSAPAYYQEQVASWGEFPEECARQGLPEIDYKAVRAFAANTMAYDSADNVKADYLAAPAALLELDFYTANKAECDSQIEVCIEQAGTCHGWLGWFQMRLGDEWLSTEGTSKKTHWCPVFLPLESPIEVEAGDKIHFSLKRPEFGEWSWATEFASRRQNQSTFLSGPLRPADLLKKSDNYRPKVAPRGEAAQWLLANVDGEKTVTVLASGLSRHFPQEFSTVENALLFARKLLGHLD